MARIDPTQLFQAIEIAGQKYGLPPEAKAVLHSIAQIESGYGRNNVGRVIGKDVSGDMTHAGSRAMGPFQFMPKTAKAYGLKNPMDPFESADAAARHLITAYRRHGDWYKAGIGHHSGPAWSKLGTHGQDYAQKLGQQLTQGRGAQYLSSGDEYMREMMGGQGVDRRMAMNVPGVPDTGAPMDWQPSGLGGESQFTPSMFATPDNPIEQRRAARQGQAPATPGAALSGSQFTPAMFATPDNPIEQRRIQRQQAAAAAPAPTEPPAPAAAAPVAAPAATEATSPAPAPVSPEGVRQTIRNIVTPQPGGLLESAALGLGSVASRGLRGIGGAIGGVLDFMGPYAETIGWDVGRPESPVFGEVNQGLKDFEAFADQYSNPTAKKVGEVASLAAIGSQKIFPEMAIQGGLTFATNPDAPLGERIGMSVKDAMTAGILGQVMKSAGTFFTGPVGRPDASGVAPDALATRSPLEIGEAMGAPILPQAARGDQRGVRMARQRIEQDVPGSGSVRAIYDESNNAIARAMVDDLGLRPPPGSQITARSDMRSMIDDKIKELNTWKASQHGRTQASLDAIRDFDDQIKRLKQFRKKTLSGRGDLAPEKLLRFLNSQDISTGRLGDARQLLEVMYPRDDYIQSGQVRQLMPNRYSRAMTAGHELFKDAPEELLTRLMHRMGVPQAGLLSTLPGGAGQFFRDYGNSVTAGIQAGGRAALLREEEEGQGLLGP